MFGILNIHKPGGMTSRDVVNAVDRLIRPFRSGHAGTLDPMATGVLVVCIGPATRLIEYVQRMRKTYHATFCLGFASDTDDAEGEVHEVPVPRIPSRDELVDVLARFTGRIEQIPPSYSAVKVQGRRAYRLARQKAEFTLEPRPVMVYRLELITYEFPELHVEIECGSGTYVRALGRDIAAALNTSAIMTALERTAVGVFRIEDACTLEQLDSAELPRYLLPARTAVAELPAIALAADEPQRLFNGLAIHRDGIDAGEYAALNSDGELVAVVRSDESEFVRPMKCFPLSSS